MKKPMLLLAFSLLLASVACKKTEPTPVLIVPKSTTVEISGEIKANKTFDADSIYLLKGFVYVSNNATLTIEPGTIIKGDKPTKGTLIITRGAKLNAMGTANNPIVFTSAIPAGGRSAGDWGGIILLGKAPINVTGGTAKIEGGLVRPAGTADDAPYIYYGGTDVADNSGTVKYVRIEYAGIPFSADNEINGLTLGGVGNGTTLEYIEVYRSGDDSFEWFGGTANAKYLLSIGAVDDDFDTDFGFSGNVQFGLAQRAQTVADASGSNGFESDNDGTGSNNTPKTSAIFSNMTVVGPLLTVTGGSVLSGINANYQHAAHIRRNSSISIFNSLFTNYTEGIYIDNTKVVTPNATTTNYTSGALVFANNLIYGCNFKYTLAGNTGDVKGDDQSKRDALIVSMVLNNSFTGAENVTNVLTDPLKYGTDFKAVGNANAGTPNFTAKAASVPASGALFSDAKFTGNAFFDKNVVFRGAFGDTNWSTGWAFFDPQTLNYTTPGKVMTN